MATDSESEDVIDVVIGDPDPKGIDDEVRQLLRRVHVAILRHPAAATALFNALVAEGRRYAATAEGADVVERLSASAAVRNAQSIWEVMSAGIISERPAGELPSALVDGFVRAAGSAGLDDFLERLVYGGPGR